MKTRHEWEQFFGHSINHDVVTAIQEDAVADTMVKYEKRIAEIYAHHEKQIDLLHAAIDRRDRDIDRMCKDMEGKDE